MDNKQRFIDMHSKILDTEFNLFCEESDFHALEFVPDSERKTVLNNVVNTQIVAISSMYELQKSSLKNIELTPKEAIEIVSKKLNEDNVFSAEGIDGSDAYRFMNNSLKMNRSVALAAYNNNPDVQKHFPKVLKEQLEGKDIGKALKSMVLSDKLSDDFFKSANNKKKVSNMKF